MSSRDGVKPFFSGASLCFGNTKTHLLCEAGHPVGLQNKIMYVKLIRMSSIKPGGRPTKELGKKRTYMVSVKMNTGEYFSLKSKAKQAGISRSEYVRGCIAGSIIKERLTPELNKYIRDLSGMGNNLNQIARKANIEGYAHIRSEYLDLAEKIDNVIDLIEDDGKNSKR